MRRIDGFAGIFAVLCLTAPALAASGWEDTTIQQFTATNGPREWAPNCASMLPGRLAITNDDLGKVSNAAVNDNLSCLRFDYQGTTYYTRTTSAETSVTKHSTSNICATLMAENGSGTHVEAATMGEGEKVDQKKCKTK